MSKTAFNCHIKHLLKHTDIKRHILINYEIWNKNHTNHNKFYKNTLYSIATWIVNIKYFILQYEHHNVLIKVWLERLQHQRISEQKVAPMSHQQTGAKKSVWKIKDDKWASGQICLPTSCKWNADNVWAHRGGTSTGKGHVSGVKLKTADGTWMLPIQHSHLHPTLSAPDMDSPILWACTTRLFLTRILKKWKKKNKTKHETWVIMLTDHDKLRVGSEARLQGQPFTIVIALRFR